MIRDWYVIGLCIGISVIGFLFVSVSNSSFFLSGKGVCERDTHLQRSVVLVCVKKDCNAKCIFSVGSMTISKLDLDLHLSVVDIN